VRRYIAILYTLCGALAIVAVYAFGSARWVNVAAALGIPWTLLLTSLGLFTQKGVAQNSWLLVLTIAINTGIVWAWAGLIRARQRSR
jgi:hypothetical protein